MAITGPAGPLLDSNPFRLFAEGCAGSEGQPSRRVLKPRTQCRDSLARYSQRMPMHTNPAIVGGIALSGRVVFVGKILPDHVNQFR